MLVMIFSHGREGRASVNGEAFETVRRSVFHPIAYRTIPGVSLQKLGSKDLTCKDVWQEGCIYAYGLSQVKKTGRDYLLEAKAMYAQLLTGIVPEHPAIKRVNLNLEQGVEGLCQILQARPIGILGRSVAYKIVMDALGFMRGVYAIPMGHALRREQIKDPESMKSFMYEFTEKGSNKPIRQELVDYFWKLFQWRQQYLKDHMDEMSAYNQCDNQHLAEVVIKRSKILPLPFKEEKLLILEGDTCDFYPIEMMIYRAMNSDRFNKI